MVSSLKSLAVPLSLMVTVPLSGGLLIRISLKESKLSLLRTLISTLLSSSTWAVSSTLLIAPNSNAPISTSLVLILTIRSKPLPRWSKGRRSLVLLSPSKSCVSWGISLLSPASMAGEPETRAMVSVEPPLSVRRGLSLLSTSRILSSGMSWSSEVALISLFPGIKPEKASLLDWLLSPNRLLASALMLYWFRISLPALVASLPLIILLRKVILLSFWIPPPWSPL